MRKALVTAVFVTVAMLQTGLAGPAVAQNAAALPPFTATAVQVLPDQTEMTGLIAKSGTDMRLEFDQGGVRLIRILRPTEGVMRILDPQTQTYMEFTGAPVPPDAVDGAASPCPVQPTPELRCEPSGQSMTISGIRTDGWVISTPQQPRPQVVYWDTQRRKALREEYPDGSVLQMSFVAMETVSGRSAEHWKMELTAQGREPLTGDWWFDTELRVVLREILPDGSERRLENIVVGPVDPALFEVPAGWQKQEPPAAPAPQN